MKEHKTNGQQLNFPLGIPGTTAQYRYIQEKDVPKSTVRTLILTLGKVEETSKTKHQWLNLQAKKTNEDGFCVWLLVESYPVFKSTKANHNVARYILQERDSQPLEFRHKFKSNAVLPSLGCWPYLIPQPIKDVPSQEIFQQKLKYLGHLYLLDSLDHLENPVMPVGTKVLLLTPDILIGPAHNSKQKDETRRYDQSDYELVQLTENNYLEMIDAGINCLRVDTKQVKWIDQCNVFYWGISGQEIEYPEYLYRSNYLGPTIFMDEPAVCTRDSVIRPRLESDQSFRKSVTPQAALENFQDYFRQVKYQGAPVRLINELSARSDVDLGEMNFLQRNIYSWETMVSSALHQLTEGEADEGEVPSAMVFEPPGRFGTLRTLPEMNMAYGCQIPVDNPKNLASIIYGFLRGASRLTDKDWGMSIYGAVDRADTFWLQTHAYDLGAKFFLYWDSYQLACVPYNEYLALSRNLRAHAESHPHRNLGKLKQVAEVVILLPPGYNLGHVYMGKGNLWGLDELNLERLNQENIKYRVVMNNFFTEIERCIRLGVAYDLLWNLDGLNLRDYREVIRIKEDGKVEVLEEGEKSVYEKARTPVRPSGIPPHLAVELSNQEGELPLEITACATIMEGSSTVYYTTGTDAQGIYNNVMVCWELYGPNEEDYRFLHWEDLEPRVINLDDSRYKIEINFSLEWSGTYRLRTATVDMVGRTSVDWKTIVVEN